MNTPGQGSLWARLTLCEVPGQCAWKRTNYTTAELACKEDRGKAAGTAAELTSDRSLFARLLAGSRSQCDVDLQGTLGRCEFSVVPPSMFECHRTMHMCQAKRKLRPILHGLPKLAPANSGTSQRPFSSSTSS
ncbi:hypothetical protein KIL84_007321 [Mauremys mutica]|uniref:Uncharacterized protein n=1 Tax=Mauremys mutica TaxID=74926 RepID=A0A9D4AUY6_9SAUR|nr:hypothetical protein KIL84_007321 [Mauremys mutica]